MYGLIGKMTAKAGQRQALLELLAEGIGEMPGCLSYVAATDLSDANAIWITEVWEDKKAHEGSLRIPAVQNAIKKAMPLIEGFGPQIETDPVTIYSNPGKPVVPDPAFW